ncbi:MAG: polymerase [Symploca sp. SIO3C6]|uniref:Polymerase n=1 Tax=Symploca sp. SIO1C4 TaxID=2607765 RepID=A0A6B3NGA3_9CYAN|nr:polymerase [Symploca sp. SIO3C6]NER29044.1 polymerase [Symploca sp. SIO1C4]
MFRHHEGRLHFAWNCTQLGLLILPLMPTFGIIGLLLASAETWRQKHRQIIRTPLNWGLALLSFWLIITACFAFNRTEAFLGLANLLPFFAVFAAFSVLIQTPAQLNRLAWMMVMPSLPVAILGLGQHFLGWKGLEQLHAVLGWVLAEGGNPPGRMASVFMYANILAAYLQIVLILSIGLWIEQFRAWRKIPNNSQNSKLWFLSILVIAQVIALFLTSSRNGWAIAILACLAFALDLGWHWLVAAVTAAVTSILWASFGSGFGGDWLRKIVPSYLWMRLSDQMYPDRPIALLRTTQWQFTWSMTLERPWLGWGLRNFTPLYEAQMNLWLGHPHNLVLMLTAEAGIPATLLLFGLVGWVIVEAIRLLRVWSVAAISSDRDHQPQHLILLTFLVAFGGCSLFNLLDVTLFDLRINTLVWLLLSAISGVVYRSRFTNSS